MWFALAGEEQGKGPPPPPSSSSSSTSLIFIPCQSRRWFRASRAAKPANVDYSSPLLHLELLLLQSHSLLIIWFLSFHVSLLSKDRSLLPHHHHQTKRSSNSRHGTSPCWISGCRVQLPLVCVDTKTIVKVFHNLGICKIFTLSSDRSRKRLAGSGRLIPKNPINNRNPYSFLFFFRRSFEPQSNKNAAMVAIVPTLFENGRLGFLPTYGADCAAFIIIARTRRHPTTSTAAAVHS